MLSSTQARTTRVGQTKVGSMHVCPFGAEHWVCNGVEQCFNCATIEHSNRHPDGDVDGCRTCKLATLQVSPSVRGVSRNQVAPTAGSNSWEKGVALDHRGIPFRDFKTGNPIPLKRFTERRSKYEEGLRAVHNGAI